MDSPESFEEGTLIANSTNSRKKNNNFIIKIGPNELTAEIPANWLDGENINSLSEVWAVNTYDLFRIFKKKGSGHQISCACICSGFYAGNN